MQRTEAPKIYLNENLSPRLAAQLRRYGFDVIASHDVDMLSRPDPEQMEFACSQQRAVLTFNIDDFVALHQHYFDNAQEHWGVIISTEEPIGVLVHRLLRLLNSVSAEELRNQLRWLNEFR